nr:ABC transporter permease [uncultured Carboxylicivirga sp.]
MFSIKLIFRRLLKNKWILFINLTGLTLAFTTILYLTSYVIQESSFDKHIKNNDRIYRMLTTTQEGSVVENYIITWNKQKMGIEDAVPEIEELTQVLRERGSSFKYQNKTIKGKSSFSASPNFFHVFQFETVYGNLDHALENKNNIVLTETLAHSVFGDQNPVGQQVLVDDEMSVVSAVIKDIPGNTHFDFDVVHPMTNEDASYTSLEYVTYILFKEGTNYEQAAKKCEELYSQKLTKGFADMDLTVGAKMEVLSDIHLNTIATYDMKENGNKTLVYFLAILSIAILIIALSNYINLIVAKKDSYVKQVSIQKVNGSKSVELVKQFFIESLLVVTAGFLLAIIIFASINQPVSNFIGVNLMDVAWQSLQFYWVLLLIYLISVLVACSYPAFLLGQIDIKDLIQPKKQRRRSVSYLLVFQFMLVSFLFIGMITVNKQIHFIENKPKGFTAENVVNFGPLSDKLNEAWPAIKNEISSMPNVAAITGSQAYPGKGGSGQGISYGNQPSFSIEEARVQSGYLDVFGIELKAGRFFAHERDSDSFIINEAAARKLGIEDPVGKQVNFWGSQVTIIGVMKDYHYSSLKDRILPLMLSNYSGYVWKMSAKLDGNNNQQTIASINSVLKKFDPDYNGTTSYLSDELKKDYAQEHALRRIFYLGTTLGLLIAIIGLLAYAAVLSSLRTKEIGIRKVNGATNGAMIMLLSNNLGKHILIGFLLATPIAWYAMIKWLENFAYKTSISWWIFVAAGFLTLVVSFIAVSWQSWRAATRNPVEALRYE